MVNFSKIIPVLKLCDLNFNPSHLGLSKTVNPLFLPCLSEIPFST